MSLTYEEQAMLIVGDVIPVFLAGYARAWAQDSSGPVAIPLTPTWFASHQDYRQFHARLLKNTWSGLWSNRQTYSDWEAGKAERDAVLTAALAHGRKAFEAAKANGQLLSGLRWREEIEPTLEDVAANVCGAGGGQGGGWVCGKK